MQQNNKRRLCRDKDETINPILSECNKRLLARSDYTTRHDWVRKVIQWQLCKKLKFRPYYQTVHTQTRLVLVNET